MKAPIQENPDAPVWARQDAFPPAPDGYGWLDAKGRSHACDSSDALTIAIRDDPDSIVTLVWAPGYQRMILPEELADMGGALRSARERWTRADLADATRKMRWGGLILCGFGVREFYGGYILTSAAADAGSRFKDAALRTLESTGVGLAALVFLIFALIPWYQARKRRAEMANWTEAGIAAAVPTLRFETWLDRQAAPVTRVLLGLIAVVGLAQLLPSDSLAAAGLLKDSHAQGEWWRLFTAPFLHGNVVHFLMNAAALAYLGKRVEVFARWPHLAMVFLFSASVGGVASARLVAAPSVGASGGLMGWLGFLLVFETLHARLVPRGARRRLAAGVVLIALIGLVGYRFIDNAAHAGGLLAGMLYAAIVFPASSSPERPRSNMIDCIAGGITLGVLLASAGFAVWRITAGNPG